MLQPLAETEQIDDRQYDHNQPDEVDDAVHMLPANMRPAATLAAGSVKTEGNGSRLAIDPVLHFFSRLVLSVPVALLDLALELLHVSVDLHKIIVRELAPLLLDLASHLFPTAGNAIPIHLMSPIAPGDCQALYWVNSGPPHPFQLKRAHISPERRSRKLRNVTQGSAMARRA